MGMHVSLAQKAGITVSMSCCHQQDRRQRCRCGMLVPSVWLDCEGSASPLMQVIWPTMGLAGSGFVVQSSATAVFSSPVAVAGTQTSLNPTEATLTDASAAPPTTYYRVVYTFPNSTIETSSTCQPVGHASGETLLPLPPSDAGAHRTLAICRCAALWPTSCVSSKLPCVM